MLEKNKISVFTPTYNRANYLKTLYTSLKNQTYINFEWLIVDDGSTDDTEAVVNSLSTDFFKIIYIKQKNGGKHSAFNTALKIASGALFFPVDSDDRLPKDSLEIIIKKFKTIENRSVCAGVVGLRCHFDKSVIGSQPFKEDIICTHLDYRFKYNVVGDRAEVFKTTILKRYPFPIYGNEKFVPESIVWNRIAQKYTMLFFNKNVYECEYLEDGLSSNSVKLRRNNPTGITTLYYELSGLKSIGYLPRAKAAINYWRFAFCKPSIIFKLFPFNKQKLFLYFFGPLGLLMNVRDKMTI